MYGGFQDGSGNGVSFKRNVVTWEILHQSQREVDDIYGSQIS